MLLRGIRPGTFLYVYSEDKGKWIKSVVTGLYGDSISHESAGFSVMIHHLEPVQGFDSRFYSSGSYSYKDIFHGERVSRTEP